MLFLSLLLFYVSTSSAQSTSEKEENTAIATLGALDKITARVSTLKAPVETPVRFGTLEITVHYCRSNPPEQNPETAAFLEIQDIDHNQSREKVFAGWMFASSPALSPLEHAVYDIWVVSCSTVSGLSSSDNR
ncbi:MAG: glycosyl hydrolase family 5 [Kordiimonas sp.]|nr:glycosyl hydrolase family 5 [Kordiimonas sp.]